MKRMSLLLGFAAFIVSSIVITPAFADEKEGMMGSGMMMEKRGMMMKAHQELTTMMREVMVILNDLNHTPTAEQKKKLEDMIKRLDEITKKQQEMMKRREERMKKEEKEED